MAVRSFKLNAVFWSFQSSFRLQKRHSCPHIWFTSHSYFRGEVLPAHRSSYGVWSAGFLQRREQCDLDIQRVGNLPLPQELGETKPCKVSSEVTPQPLSKAKRQLLLSFIRLVRLSEYLRVFSAFFRIHFTCFQIFLSSGNVRSGREAKPGFLVLGREQQEVHKGCSVTCPLTDKYPSLYNNF